MDRVESFSVSERRALLLKGAVRRSAAGFHTRAPTAHVMDSERSPRRALCALLLCSFLTAGTARLYRAPHRPPREYSGPKATCPSASEDCPNFGPVPTDLKSVICSTRNSVLVVALGLEDYPGLGEPTWISPQRSLAVAVNRNMADGGVSIEVSDSAINDGVFEKLNAEVDCKTFKAKLLFDVSPGAIPRPLENVTELLVSADCDTHGVFSEPALALLVAGRRLSDEDLSSFAMGEGFSLFLLPDSHTTLPACTESRALGSQPSVVLLSEPEPQDALVDCKLGHERDVNTRCPICAPRMTRQLQDDICTSATALVVKRSVGRMSVQDLRAPRHLPSLRLSKTSVSRKYNQIDIHIQQRRRASPTLNESGAAMCTKGSLAILDDVTPGGVDADASRINFELSQACSCDFLEQDTGYAVLLSDKSVSDLGRGVQLDNSFKLISLDKGMTNLSACSDHDVMMSGDQALANGEEDVGCAAPPTTCPRCHNTLVPELYPLVCDAPTLVRVLSMNPAQRDDTGTFCGKARVIQAHRGNVDDYAKTITYSLLDGCNCDYVTKPSRQYYAFINNPRPSQGSKLNHLVMTDQVHMIAYSYRNARLLDDALKICQPSKVEKRSDGFGYVGDQAYQQPQGHAASYGGASSPLYGPVQPSGRYGQTYDRPSPAAAYAAAPAGYEAGNLPPYGPGKAYASPPASNYGATPASTYRDKNAGYGPAQPSEYGGARAPGHVPSYTSAPAPSYTSGAPPSYDGRSGYGTASAPSYGQAATPSYATASTSSYATAAAAPSYGHSASSGHGAGYAPSYGSAGPTYASTLAPAYGFPGSAYGTAAAPTYGSSGPTYAPAPAHEYGSSGSAPGTAAAPAYGSSGPAYAPAPAHGYGSSGSAYGTAATPGYGSSVPAYAPDSAHAYGSTGAAYRPAPSSGHGSVGATYNSAPAPGYGSYGSSYAAAPAPVYSSSGSVYAPNPAHSYGAAPSSYTEAPVGSYGHGGPAPGYGAGYGTAPSYGSYPASYHPPSGSYGNNAVKNAAQPAMYGGSAQNGYRAPGSYAQSGAGYAPPGASYDASYSTDSTYAPAYGVSDYESLYPSEGDYAPVISYMPTYAPHDEYSAQTAANAAYAAPSYHAGYGAAHHQQGAAGSYAPPVYASHSYPSPNAPNVHVTYSVSYSPGSASLGPPAYAAPGYKTPAVASGYSAPALYVPSAGHYGGAAGPSNAAYSSPAGGYKNAAPSSGAYSPGSYSSSPGASYAPAAYNPHAGGYASGVVSSGVPYVAAPYGASGVGYNTGVAPAPAYHAPASHGSSAGSYEAAVAPSSASYAPPSYVPSTGGYGAAAAPSSPSYLLPSYVPPAGAYGAGATPSGASYAPASYSAGAESYGGGPAQSGNYYTSPTRASVHSSGDSSYSGAGASYRPSSSGAYNSDSYSKSYSSTPASATGTYSTSSYGAAPSYRSPVTASSDSSNKEEESYTSSKEPPAAYKASEVQTLKAGVTTYGASQPSHEASHVPYASPSYAQPGYSQPTYVASYAPLAYAAPSSYGSPDYSASVEARPFHKQPSYDVSYAPPAYAAPSYAPPSYASPPYAQQSYSQPSYESSYAPPAYASPSYAPPAYAVPSYAPPAYAAPSYAPPNYAVPAYDSSYAPPAYAPPSYAQPSYETSYAPPAYTAPSYAPPFYVQPSYSQPHYDATYAPPSHVQPHGPLSYGSSYPEASNSNGSPSYSNLQYNPAYAQPAYIQPSYNQPPYGASYAPPAYAAPSYLQPSYNQAPVQAYDSSNAQPSYAAPPKYAHAHQDSASYAPPQYSAAPVYKPPHAVYGAPVAPAYGAAYPAMQEVYQRPLYGSHGKPKGGYGQAPYGKPPMQAVAVSYTMPALPPAHYQPPVAVGGGFYSHGKQGHANTGHATHANSAPSYGAAPGPYPSYSAPAPSGPSYGGSHGYTAGVPSYGAAPSYPDSPGPTSGNGGYAASPSSGTSYGGAGGSNYAAGGGAAYAPTYESPNPSYNSGSSGGSSATKTEASGSYSTVSHAVPAPSSSAAYNVPTDYSGSGTPSSYAGYSTYNPSTYSTSASPASYSRPSSPTYAAPSSPSTDYGASGSHGSSYTTANYAAPSYGAPPKAGPSYGPPSSSSHSEAASAAPTYSAPSYSGERNAPPSLPAGSHASYSAPTYSPTGYSNPVSVPATNVAPSYSGPSHAPQPEVSAGYAAPTYAGPSYVAPSYSAPAPPLGTYAVPSYHAPLEAKSNYHLPTASAPGYSGPSKSASSYSAPNYSAPTSAPATYAVPSYSPPGHYSDPTPAPVTYAAPSYSVPSFPQSGQYPAPTSAPVSYATQSYPAPSYSPPEHYSAQAATAANYAANTYPPPGNAATSYSAPASSSPQSYYASTYSAPSYTTLSYHQPAAADGSYAPTSSHYADHSYNKDQQESGYVSSPGKGPYSGRAPSYHQPQHYAAAVPQDNYKPSCPPAPRTCPVCVRAPSKELLKNVCGYDLIVEGEVNYPPQPSKEYGGVCSEMCIGDALRGKGKNVLDKIRFSLNKYCPCKATAFEFSKVIVLTNRHSWQTHGGYHSQLQLDHSTLVLDHNAENLKTLKAALERCPDLRYLHGPYADAAYNGPAGCPDAFDESCPDCPKAFVPEDVTRDLCSAEYASVVAIGLDYTQMAEHKNGQFIWKPPYLPEVQINEETGFGKNVSVAIKVNATPSRHNDSSAETSVDSQHDSCLTYTVKSLYNVSRGLNPVQDAFDQQLFLNKQCGCNHLKSQLPSYGLLIVDKQSRLSSGVLQLGAGIKLYPLLSGDYRLPSCRSGDSQDEQPGELETPDGLIEQLPPAELETFEDLTGEDRPDVAPCPEQTRESCPVCLDAKEDADVVNQYCKSDFAAVVSIADDVFSSTPYTVHQPWWSPKINVSKVSYQSKRQVSINIRAKARYQFPEMDRTAGDPTNPSMCRSGKLHVKEELMGRRDESSPFSFTMLDSCHCKFLDEPTQFAVLVSKTVPKSGPLHLSEEQTIISIPLGKTEFPKCVRPEKKAHSSWRLWG